MEIFCKLDNLQRTGSFKERGARNALVATSARSAKARRHRRFRRQSRPGARLPGQVVRHSGHRRDAEVRAAHQGQQLPETRRERRASRKRFRRSQGARARDRQGKRPRLHRRL